MAANDPKDVMIPVSLFRAHATLPASDPDLPGSYTIDFGKFEKSAIKVSGEPKEIWKANSTGFIGLDVLRRAKGKLTFEGELKHLAPAFLAYWMGSASGSAPAPGKIVDLFGFIGIEAEGEPLVPTGNSNEGAGILVWHSFAFGLQLEGDLTANGDDFGMLKVIGHIYLGRTPGVWTAGTRPITPAGP